jgi:hypothetical protein
MSVQVKGSGTIGGLDEGLNITGVCTATSFSGTASGNATISNNADNRVITGGSGNALNGESGLTYNGSAFTLSSGRLNLTDESSGQQLSIGASGDFNIEHDSNHTYLGNNTGDIVIQNDANVKITAKAGGTERFRFTSGGQLNIGGDYTQNSYNLSVTNTGGNLFRIKTANEGDYDLRFMIQNSEANIWHYGTDDLVFGNRYDRKLHLLTNGSKRLTVNGDLVGINNTSPAKTLHVTASSVATVRVETLDSRGQAWDILSTNGAQNNTGTLSFRDESGSAYLEFGANGGSPELTVRNGGANDLLHIDNNGNVTKPRNAFAIIYTNSGDAGASNNKIKDAYAVFTGIHLNQGSHYSTSTGRFTCPVDGVYGVAFSSNCNMSNLSVGNNFNIQTRKNGSIMLYNYNTTFTQGWQQMTFTNYVNCNANDWLALYFSGSQVWGADQGSGQWGEVYFWLAQ